MPAAAGRRRRTCIEGELRWKSNIPVLASCGRTPTMRGVRGLRACGRFGMDVRAGAEIRRGQVRPGRLVVAANRPLGRVSDRSAG